MKTKDNGQSAKSGRTSGRGSNSGRNAAPRKANAQGQRAGRISNRTAKPQEDASNEYLGLNHIGSWAGLAAWPMALLIYLAARFIPDAAEKVFAKGIFRGYGAVVSRLSGLLPFSLAEFLLIGFVSALLIIIIVAAVRFIRNSGNRFLRLVRFVKNLLVTAGVLFLIYMIGCGTNYYRYEFATYSNLTLEKSSKQELYELCLHLAQRANETREEACKSEMNDDELAMAATAAMEKLGKKYPILDGYYPQPKQVIFSRTMSRFGITGVYFPWTVEANVNVDVTEYSHASTMCHELSHLRGFMREDEANFIAFLACEESEDARLNYSGYMLALINAGNRLYEDDRELYFKVVGTYSEGVRADLKKNNEYWDAFRDKVTSEVGEKINNAYLKANNVEDGTKSYGRMVDLLLAEYRKAGKSGK